MTARNIILGVFLLASVSAQAVWVRDTTALEVSHTAMTGVDSVPAEFFRQWYHRSDLIYYLEALNDHAIVETHTTGQWWLPDRWSFAVNGLPCTNNRYYIDGFRVDDRFQPGSTVYVPNMQQYDLAMDIHSGQLYFSRDTMARDYVRASYNFGQVGNGAPAAGTQAIINIFHRSAVQSADTYKHITARRHQAGAGTVAAAYTFRDKEGNPYRQHLFAAYGQRLITREDERGLILDDPFYNAYYYKVQADGLLPIKPNNAFTEVGYRVNFSGRADDGSEYLYNFAEVYDHKNYTASMYAKRQYLTTGLTWSLNTVKHDNQSFSKNIIDQDGESFAPWIADGHTHDLSWAVNYEQPVLPWLSVHVDAYNSLVHFSPTNETFSNDIYFQSPIATAPTALYRYDWQSKAFTGGILENTVGLKAHYAICKQLDINGFVDFTLDGILLRNKSKVSPNFQAGVNFDLHPCKWFEMGLTVSHERLPYTADYLRYFSDDYMNADIYSAATNTFFATTGGKYHHHKKGLHQTSYLEVNIPIRFVFGGGRHEIVLQNSYKKFFNVWHTYYLGDASKYGYYVNYDKDPAYEDNATVFYQLPGVKEYEVGYTEPFGTNGLLNSPYYFSQLSRYTYTGRKVIVSFGWQSMQAAGYVGLGNGANSNTMGVLSEATANPNTSNVINNQEGRYPAVSRMDLDKGFVARFYLAYNICEWVQAGLTFKWTDGKPFTSYNYFYRSAAESPTGGAEVAILPRNSRGTNPTDGNFGTRHGAVFHCDLHLQGKWKVKDTSMCLNIECYNIWDFCHDLCEMAFVQDIPYAMRASMILTVPTGILATYTVEL